MSISLFEAIKNVRDDDNWALKTFLVSVFMFIYSVLINFTELKLDPKVTLIAVALGIATGVYIFGFIFKTVHKGLNSDNFKFANFNDQNLMLIGLKGWGSILLYSIIVYLISVFVFCILGILLALMGMLVYGLLVSVLGLNQNIVLAVIIIFAIILLVLISLFVTMFMNTAMICYYKNLRFTDILAFDIHFKIVKENYKTCWTFVGKTILYSLLCLLVFLALAISLVGLLLIPFVYAYAYLVYCNLQVQFAKTIQIEKYID